MHCWDHMPTLTDLLADPLIRAVMAADCVDPAVLEASLRALAQVRSLTGDPAGARRNTFSW